MTSQHSTATGGRLKHGVGWWGIVAGSALLTVAVVAAIGVWQGGDQRSTRTAGPEAAAPVSAAVTPTRSTTAGSEDAVVYLVSSPAQAVVVQADIDAGRTSAEGQWISTPQAGVLVAGTPEDAARVAEMMSADYHSRLTSGRPAMRVVDLRAQPMAAGP